MGTIFQNPKKIWNIFFRSNSIIFKHLPCINNDFFIMPPLFPGFPLLEIRYGGSVTMRSILLSCIFFRQVRAFPCTNLFFPRFLLSALLLLLFHKMAGSAPIPAFFYSERLSLFSPHYPVRLSLLFFSFSSFLPILSLSFSITPF